MSAPHISNVAAGVKTLAIPGITILDLDEMPDAVSDRALPMLGPSANDPSFLTDWTAKRISLQGNQQNEYTLNYTYFHAKIGSERGLFRLWPAMVANVQTIIGALQAAEVAIEGCKRLSVLGLPQFGPVHDASGQQFHGATLALHVIEL